jgi:hypothetical protein
MSEVPNVTEGLTRTYNLLDCLIEDEGLSLERPFRGIIALWFCVGPLLWSHLCSRVDA